MGEAVFGLVGVVVGALLSGGTEWMLARRREQHAARTAARVVRDELYLVAVWLEDLSGGEWTLPEGWRYDASVWRDQRIHLAAILPYDQYARAQRAHHTAARFSVWAIEHGPLSRPPDSSYAVMDSAEAVVKPPYVDIWLTDLREGLQALLEVAR